VPYGRNFRGAGRRSDLCSVNKKVSILDLKKIDRESTIRSVCGSEFQTDGADNQKARPEKSAQANG